MNESLHLNTERPKKSSHPILIFGSGPILDRATRIKAADAQTVPGDEDITFWSENLAVAAVILVQESPVQYTFFISGGRTGGKDYISEAEGIGVRMRQLGVDPEKSVYDNEAQDTVENIVNVLNIHEGKNDPLTDHNMSVLSMNPMAHRVKVFMKLFAISIKNAFTAEEVLRYKACVDQNSQELLRIERILDVNANGDGFYREQKGAERRDVFERNLHDNLWVRQFLEYPQRMLRPAVELNNDARLVEVVRRLFFIHSDEMNEFGINLTDAPDVMRTKMREIKWPFQGDEEKARQVKQWEKENVSYQGWPQRIVEKYNRLQQL